MKKYEAPMMDMMNVSNDIIASSGLLADLDKLFDPVSDDIFVQK